MHCGLGTVAHKDLLIVTPLIVINSLVAHVQRINDIRRARQGSGRVREFRSGSYTALEYTELSEFDQSSHA